MDTIVNPPQIAYRESILQRAIGERKYVRYFDGRGHFAHVRLELIPSAVQSPMVSRADDLPLPEGSYHAAGVALLRKMKRGPLQGFPMMGLKARLIAATYREKYSDSDAVGHAASMAFDEAMLLAKAVVMEPWIGVRLHVAEDALNHTLTTLTRFLGEIAMSLTRGEHYVIRVPIPIRLVKKVSAALERTRLETFALDPSIQYRPLRGMINFEKSSDGLLEEWT